MARYYRQGHFIRFVASDPSQNFHIAMQECAATTMHAAAELTASEKQHAVVQQIIQQFKGEIKNSLAQLRNLSKSSLLDPGQLRALNQG